MVLLFIAFLVICEGGSLSRTCVKELKKLEGKKKGWVCGKLEKFGMGVLGMFGC